MKDETKAAIIAGIWLGCLAIFCANPNATRFIILAFVTIIIVMYLRSDHKSEQQRRRTERYKRHAEEELARELSGEKKRSIIEEYSSMCN